MSYCTSFWWPSDFSSSDLLTPDPSPLSSTRNFNRSKKLLPSDYSPMINLVFSPSLLSSSSLLSPAVLFSLLFSSSLLLSPASSIACYDGCRLAPGASRTEVWNNCVWKHDCGVCAVHADDVSQRVFSFLSIYDFYLFFELSLTAFYQRRVHSGIF